MKRPTEITLVKVPTLPDPQKQAELLQKRIELLTSKVETAEKQRFKHAPETTNVIPLADLVVQTKEVSRRKPARVQTAHRVQESKKVEGAEVKLQELSRRPKFVTD